MPPGQGEPKATPREGEKEVKIWGCSLPHCLEAVWQRLVERWEMWNLSPEFFKFYFHRDLWMLSAVAAEHYPGTRTSGTNRRAEFRPEPDRHLGQFLATGAWGRM